MKNTFKIDSLNHLNDIEKRLYIELLNNALKDSDLKKMYEYNTKDSSFSSIIGSISKDTFLKVLSNLRTTDIRWSSGDIENEAILDSSLLGSWQISSDPDNLNTFIINYSIPDLLLLELKKDENKDQVNIFLNSLLKS